MSFVVGRLRLGGVKAALEGVREFVQTNIVSEDSRSASQHGPHAAKKTRVSVPGGGGSHSFKGQTKKKSP